MSGEQTPEERLLYAIFGDDGHEVITEADVVGSDGLPLSDEEMLTDEEFAQLEADWEYQREVEDCCGGHDWTCGHYRGY